MCWLFDFFLNAAIKTIHWENSNLECLRFSFCNDEQINASTKRRSSFTFAQFQMHHSIEMLQLSFQMFENIDGILSLYFISKLSRVYVYFSLALYFCISLYLSRCACVCIAIDESLEIVMHFNCTLTNQFVTVNWVLE